MKTSAKRKAKIGDRLLVDGRPAVVNHFSGKYAHVALEDYRWEGRWTYISEVEKALNAQPEPPTEVE